MSISNIANYVKTVWKAGREGGTAWTPARLNNAEDGIELNRNTINTVINGVNTNATNIATNATNISAINQNFTHYESSSQNVNSFDVTKTQSMISVDMIGGHTEKIDGQLISSKTSAVQFSKDDCVKSEFVIPNKVLNLPDYGVGLDDTCYNYIEYVDGKWLYHHDCVVVSLNGVEQVIEASGEITDITSYFTSNNLLPIEKDGTIEFVNENNLACPSTITYLGVTESVKFLNDDIYTKMDKSNPTGTGSFSLNRKAGTTVGDYSFAEGYNTAASGYCTHAEGSSTKATESCSHAEGDYTTASGKYSHAEGSYTTASGYAAHAEGSYTTASGYTSHAEGVGTTASGICSHAEGGGTTASNYSSHASGKYNANMTIGGAFNNQIGTAFVIGNGTGDTAKSNAFSVQYNGVTKAMSTITASTTADYAEFFEWLDENPNSEDRVGKFVTVEGDKVRIANNNDEYILGVVSGRPFVLGNGDCDVWTQMYLTDEFNRYLTEPAEKYELVETTEEVTREEEYFDEETKETKTRTITETVVTGHEEKQVFDEDGNPVYDGTRYVVNPKYNPSRPYISRLERPEWAAVGMLGVLSVYHDGTAKVNSYVTVNADGIATACNKNDDNSYRVIKSMTDNVVQIIFR